MSEHEERAAAEDTEEARQDRLRRNNSFDPEGKTHEDEANPMHPDSWSGGSIVPDAKRVARGEAPATHGPGPGTPDPGIPPATPSEVTRPWSPEPTQGDTSGSTPGVDYAGRERGEEGEVAGDAEPRQAPATTSPQEGEPAGDRPQVTKGG